MKLVTKLTVAAITATFMFGAINLTWGNAFTNTDNTLGVSNQFGVWLDVNDAMSFGWEGRGLKVGFNGPAGMQVRLGYDTTAANADGQGDAGVTLGMARTWWTSTGDGWGTSLSTAIDFNMTNGTGVDAADAADDIVPGFWTLTMNLGFGF